MIKFLLLIIINIQKNNIPGTTHIVGEMIVCLQSIPDEIWSKILKGIDLRVSLVNKFFLELLRRITYDVISPGLNRIECYPSLRTLDLIYPEYGFDGNIARYTRLSNLTCDMFFDKIERSKRVMIDLIHQIVNMTQLRNLDLIVRNRSPYIGNGSITLSRLTNLHTLTIRERCVDMQITGLTALSSLTKLSIQRGIQRGNMNQKIKYPPSLCEDRIFRDGKLCLPKLYSLHISNSNISAENLLLLTNLTALNVDVWEAKYNCLTNLERLTVQKLCQNDILIPNLKLIHFGNFGKNCKYITTLAEINTHTME